MPGPNRAQCAPPHPPARIDRNRPQSSRAQNRHYPRPGKAVGEDAALQIFAKRLTDIRLWGVVVALAVELAFTSESLGAPDTPDLIAACAYSTGAIARFDSLASLQPPQRRIPAVARRQLVGCVALHNTPSLQQVDAAPSASVSYQERLSIVGGLVLEVCIQATRTRVPYAAWAQPWQACQRVFCTAFLRLSTRYLC